MSILALILSLWLPPVYAEVAVPPLSQRVTDLTDTLTPAQRADFEQRLAALEHEKGSQLALLLVPTTQPETIEQYGIRAVDAWKLGRKGVDDGALILFAKQDRAVRIEVGRGLEGAIPDAIAKRVVEDTMIPFFKRGDFHGGLSAGIDRLAALIRGESLPTPAPFGHIGGKKLLALFMGGVAGGHLLRIVLGPALAGLLGAAGAALLAAWLGLPIFFALIMGLFVFLMVAVDTRGGRHGGWYGGGGAGGFGGGGGGFSGGGGGFSGGGASGRW
jgi:uncharacterized protein